MASQEFDSPKNLWYFNKRRVGLLTLGRSVKMLNVSEKEKIVSFRYANILICDIANTAMLTPTLLRPWKTKIFSYFKRI